MLEKDAAASSPSLAKAAAAEDSPNERKSARFSEGITALECLLNASPSAEELSRTWSRSGTRREERDDGLRLKDLKVAFDAGRRIHTSGEEASSSASGRHRGIPMWIVVRMCKASWHADGTWPLVGADEEVIFSGEQEPAPLPIQQQNIARSVHPSSLLLRPAGVKTFQLPPAADDVEERKAETTADEIAAAYRRRGCFVAEATPVEEDEGW